jgi:hypothetical protein
MNSRRVSLHQNYILQKLLYIYKQHLLTDRTSFVIES